MSNNMSHLKAVRGAQQRNCIWTVLSHSTASYDLLGILAAAPFYLDL